MIQMREKNRGKKKKKPKQEHKDEGLTAVALE